MPGPYLSGPDVIDARVWTMPSSSPWTGTTLSGRHRGMIALPARRRVRNRVHDYASAGWYFVTVCAEYRTPVFGELVGEEVRLNEYGRIVDACWRAIPEHFAFVGVDTFAVMPDHVHGILEFAPSGAPPAPASRAGGTTPGSLAVVVGSFKGAVTKAVNERRATPGGGLWQRGFHDHVVRDLADLARIREYIRQNPSRHASSLGAR